MTKYFFLVIQKEVRFEINGNCDLLLLYHQSIQTVQQWVANNYDTQYIEFDILNHKKVSLRFKDLYPLFLYITFRLVFFILSLF